ncbi:MAG: anti-sigma factor [Bacteroidota bacterium]
MAEKKHIERALLEQYVLGLTSEEENKIIETYLARHPELAAEVKESQQFLEDFAMEYAIDPPSHLKGEVLKAVKSAAVSEPKTRTKLAVSWITGIAAALALGFAFTTFLLYQQQSNLQNQISALDNQVQQLEGQNTKLVNKSTQINQQFSTLTDINTDHVHLRGSELSPQALIVVYWNEIDKNAYLNVVELPDIPDDKSLQLWADVEGEMVDMGVLETTAENGLIQVPYIPNAESLNITLEPKGGSKTPNVKQLYANGEML